MSPWSKQQPTRPTSSQKQTRPISVPKPIRSISPPKSTRLRSPSKLGRPTSSSKPSRTTSSKKPRRTTSSQKPKHPLPPKKQPNKPQHIIYIPQKPIWPTKNSKKQAELIPESTKSKKILKNKNSEQFNYKANDRKVSKPNDQTANDDAHKFFGRIFRRRWKIGNNDVLVNRAQEFGNDGGISGTKKKNRNALKDKDTVKATKGHKNSQVSVSFSGLENKAEKKNKFKRMLRRQVWRLSKGSIKGNQRLSTLLAENNINIDNIKPEEIDGSLINVDALGIQNKLLKRTVTWLLK